MLGMGLGVGEGRGAVGVGEGIIDATGVGVAERDVDGFDVCVNGFPAFFVAVGSSKLKTTFGCCGSVVGEAPAAIAS